MTDPLPPRVFLIAEPTFKRNQNGGSLPSLTPLHAHGRVQALITAADPRPTDFPDEVLRLIDERLLSFREDVDYLAWGGGDTLTAFLTGVALERQGVNSVQWLRYDRAILPNGERTEVGARYVPITITLSSDDE